MEPEIVECDVCRAPLPVRYEIADGHLHYRGVYSERTRTPGSDVERCLAGKITVSELRL